MIFFKKNYICIDARSPASFATCTSLPALTRAMGEFVRWGLRGRLEESTLGQSTVQVLGASLGALAEALMAVPRTREPSFVIEEL
jgi:hypothetical protein